MKDAGVDFHYIASQQSMRMTATSIVTEYLPIAVYVDLTNMLALNLIDNYLLSTHT